jgi:hypothetical protein
MSLHPPRPASLKWYAIYADVSHDAVEEVWRTGVDVLGRFDMAALLGRIGRRSIRAMWIIDDATDEVLRVHGPVPRMIADRHSRGLSKKPPAPSLSLQQILRRSGGREP